ncbi:unnamed protein product [Phytophthora fragariaefolia]|uniref:Unnamed protein product n=1 Tax=Phytophthora fragariaefolia TaxID=1490495 RepID=A0A9W7CZD7_9STRA|nr:unnamed protein product [Phytophthora fragariaefolia]
MAVLINLGASFNFATKVSVVRDSALYASALEASHGNTNVSVRLTTGSIVSTRKVVLPLIVKFDDFDSVEQYIVLDMDDRYDLILGMPWLAKNEPWIDWRSRTIGASHKHLANRALVSHVPPLPETGLCMSTVCREANNILLLNQFTQMKAVVAGSPQAEGHAGVGARAVNNGRVRAPTTQVVTSGSARAEGRGEWGASAPKDETLRVLNVLTGVRHEIDLVPGTKYCTTRQCPLPKEHVDVIDASFAAKHAAGMVRGSKSSHSSPTLCVRKPKGPGCTVFSALGMVDSYYQLLMRESDIPLTAVSTPSGMLWEWQVMPQGLSSAPAMFNRLVT